ncbi:hypothetical protein DSO57_1035751 [Entomophthora muscae]|uniref:Uncharacterized protein n=1 Tax=Entomophthora muscae TaxID=34485 RepID=A0ACC2S1L8_9FUNG|nr:hypothetical protein DSO57_1035751 [Entomophthora muscae]
MICQVPQHIATTNSSRFLEILPYPTTKQGTKLIKEVSYITAEQDSFPSVSPSQKVISTIQIYLQTNIFILQPDHQPLSRAIPPSLQKLQLDLPSSSTHRDYWQLPLPKKLNLSNH